MKISKILATLVAIGVIGGAGYTLTQKLDVSNNGQETSQIVSEENMASSDELQEEVLLEEEADLEQVDEAHIEEEATKDSDLENEIKQNYENVAEAAEQIVNQSTEQAQENIEEIKDEDISEEHQKAIEQASVIEEKLETAKAAFEADGMVDTYAKMRTGQKKKWLSLMNENDYFGDSSMQYQISSIYELGDNQYYILGFSAPAGDKLKLAEKWSEAQKETYLPQEAFELVLREEDGNYFVTQAIYPSEQILSSDEVALYKKEEQAESNVEIEYNKVNRLKGVEEYVDYLDQAIQEVSGEITTDGIADGSTEAINDAGQSEVTQYVQYAIENLATTTTVAEENTIDVKTELLEEMKEAMTSAKDKFNDLLAQNDISFNKSLNTVLKLETQATNFKKPIYISLPEQVEDLGEVTGLRVVIDENSYVYISGEDLESLSGLQIRIERLKDKKSYQIDFINESGEIIPQLEQTLTFAFKAKDEFTTVVKMNGEEEQNWGGQYESATNSISFGTKYSGIYKVVDNNVKIKDISHLTSNQQSAIKFMVSKGYLTLENERFNPEHTFTRYEFAEALVKMFFALDTSLETSFKDVPQDSPYYPYVASGETYEIIKGFADGTFKGDTHILKEQVISLCARTIADQKGYVYPEHTEDYLKFADADTIGKWAKEDIALAVQSGLTTAGGSLMPKAEITKAESAEVLYELFMLLYETTPDNVVEITAEQKTYSILGTFLVLALALWVIWKFIKKFAMMLTMIACTIAIIITLIIGFSGGF